MRAVNPSAGIQRPDIPLNPPQPPLHGQVRQMSAPDRLLFDAITGAHEADFVSLMTAALAEGAKIDAVDHAGNSVIEVAIQRNSLRILQALLARGAPLPVVPPSGVDLVMQAAAKGNADIVSLLIDEASMLADATDESGCSALHYAVLSQSVPTVAALLQRGADCNRAAVGMSEAIIDALFGPRHGLSGADITPLNIAIARHQIPVARLLLEHGADLNIGWRNSLWIAVRQQDSAMLAALLAHCIDTRQVFTAINQAVLESALLDTPKTTLLRQLLSCHDAQSNEALDLDTALLVAVTLGHADQAAVLLAEGARPELDAEDDKPIWSAAFEQEGDTMLNVLIASCHIPFGALLLSRPDAPPQLLTDLCHMAAEPIRLAAHGIFPEIIEAALPQLRQIARNSEHMPAAELAAATAMILVRVLPKTLPAQSASDSDSDIEDAPAQCIPAGEFQRGLPGVGHTQSGMIAEGIMTRRRLMSVVATGALNSLQSALTAALSPDFLRGAQQRATERGTEAFIAHALSEEHGVPGSLAQMMAKSWSESVQVIGGALPANLRAISRLLALTLYCKLDEHVPAPGSLLLFCHNVLMPELLSARAPVLNLVRQPAHFLRAIEQRNGWRPVDSTALSRSVRDATGLPAAVCDAISACWQQAIADDSQALGNDVQIGGANHRFLSADRRFASYWLQWLEENASDAGETVLPLTPEEVLLAMAWCESTRASDAVGLPESRKRKPVAEAAGAPPAKSSRTE